MFRNTFFLALIIAVSPQLNALAQSKCVDGSDPLAIVESVRGAVSAVEAAARPVSAVSNVMAGDELCGGTVLNTGAEGSVELFLIGQRTTISASNDTTLVLPPNPGGIEVRSGIARFISSVRGFFEVQTPYQNAGIEGTEAVLVANPARRDSLILMLEGRVVVSRPAGQGEVLEITRGEASFASSLLTPRRVDADSPRLPDQYRDLLLDPQGAADWSIYYPPTSLAASSDAVGVREAAVALARGDTAQADALDESSGEGLNGRDLAAALAIRAVAAVFRNRKDEALDLATAAVDEGSDLVAPHIALSYALQAAGQIEDALAAAREGVSVDINDADAAARLAELALIAGRTHEAQTAVRRAIELRETSLALTVLGFATLAADEVEKASNAFARAITLASDSPGPRLGMGLVQARLGDFDAARRSLELAVSLDPRRASLRAWLARTYLQTGEGSKAAAQLELAIAADPDDPTPYLISAFERFAANDPIGAQAMLDEVRARQYGRLTLRTREGLGEDQAVLGASLARIYDTLGFDALLDVEAAAAVEAEPRNPAAFRAFGEATRGEAERRISRLSSLLRADFLAPPSLAPLQPQLRAADIVLLEPSGAARTTFAEFGGVFISDGTRVDLNVFGGNRQTRGFEGSFAAMANGTSGAIGVFRSDTDGFGVNSDVRTEILAGSLKSRVNPDLTLTLDARTTTAIGGDRLVTTPPPIPSDPDARIEAMDNRLRGGFHWRLGSAAEFIGYAEVAGRKSNLSSRSDPSALLQTEEVGAKGEILGIFRNRSWQAEAGLEYQKADFDGLIGVMARDGETEAARAHFSIGRDEGSGLSWRAGLALEHFQASGAGPDNVKRFRAQPRLGVRYRVSDGLALRASYSSSVARRSLFPETLELPTLAGFDTFVSDVAGADATIIGVGLDGKIGELRYGIALTQTEIDVPNEDGTDFETKITDLAAYAAYSITDRFAITIEPRFERFKNDDRLLADRLDTYVVPARVTYHHPNGFFAGATAEYIRQSGDVTVNRSEHFKDQGLILGALVGYRFSHSDGPKGRISFEARNIFDEDLALVERDVPLSAGSFDQGLFVQRQFTPGREFFLTMSLQF